MFYVFVYSFVKYLLNILFVPRSVFLYSYDYTDATSIFVEWIFGWNERILKNSKYTQIEKTHE